MNYFTPITATAVTVIIVDLVSITEGVGINEENFNH